MKQKKFLFFAGFVALIASYAIYDFKQEQRTEILKEEQSRLVFLKPEQISYLEFDTKNGKFVIEKTVDGWNIVAPFKDAANSASVDMFIQALTTEKSKEVVEGPGDRPVSDLSVFGFDQPLGTILLKDNLGDSRKITVGSVKNFQGDAYVRVDERNEISISSSTWFAKIDKKVSDFRDLRLLRTPAAKIESFQITKGREKFKIVSKEGIWTVVEKPDMKLDQNRVRGFLTALNTTEAIEVIADQKLSSSQLQSWGLLTPAWTVSATLTDNANWQAKVASGTKDNIFRIYVSSPEFVFKIAPTEQAKLLSYDLDNFRDRFEPFLFDSAKIKKVEIRTDLKAFELEKSKGSADSLETWKLAKEVSGFRLNQDALIDFVNKLSALSVHDFTSLKTHPALEKSAKSIVVKSETGDVLFSMTVGTSGKTYYAKTDRYPWVFTLSEEEYQGLKLEKILVSEKEKENQ